MGVVVRVVVARVTEAVESVVAWTAMCGPAAVRVVVVATGIGHPK